MTEEFKILSPREHVRERIGMYLGSSSVEEVNRFVMGKWKTVSYVPALVKMVDELIDNSCDDAIRAGFPKGLKIDVSVDGEEITVTDNGRGIPQDTVHDNVSGEEMLRPVAAWTKTNAGTSFDDERVTIGTNGVGSAATNFLSIKFVGQTWQKGKMVEVACQNGGLSTKVAKKSKVGSGTSVSFIPDFDLFEVSSIHGTDILEMVEDRLCALQMAFPEIVFSFNKNKVKTNNLKQYSSLFSEDCEIVSSQSDNLLFFFTASEDGFRHNSYINGVNTRLGGSYVDFVVNGIVEELVSMVKRKHKIDVAKSTIKNGLTFILFARNFTNPKFDSQTKERLTSTNGTVKSHYEKANGPDFKYVARKILNSPTIIDPIIEAQLAKKMAEEKRQATLAQKKLKKAKIPKHIAANSKDATLFLAEGDSACAPFINVRDPKKNGAFPLRGVVMNTWDMKPADVLKNKELSELVSVLGLDISNPDSVDVMDYAKIATLTDADHDGAHIASLLVAFFYKFWPRIIEEKRLLIVRTPIMISTKGKDVKWFYTYNEAKDFKENSKGYKHRYIKGLGSLTESEYYYIINEPVFDEVHVDNAKWFQVMFGNDSQPRKQWLKDETPDILKERA